jgi:DNA-binding GntR family transcriptional regulator
MTRHNMAHHFIFTYNGFCIQCSKSINAINPSQQNTFSKVPTQKPPSKMSALAQIAAQPDLVERIHSALVEAICTGELAPGERFTQEQLAERLGVSRQPVIQSLLLLKNQGLVVDSENRRGILIAPLNADFVSHLYKLRSSLDSLAAKLAANNTHAGLKSEGQDLLRQGKKAALDGTLSDVVQADLAFHEFIYRASGNPLLIASAQLHWHHTRRVMSWYLKQASAMRPVWQEHQLIFNAVLAGDGRTAEKLSKRHAEDSINVLFTSFLAAEQEA